MKGFFNILFLFSYFVITSIAIFFIIKSNDYRRKLESHSESLKNTQTSFSENVYFDAQRIKLKNERFETDNFDSINLSDIFTVNEAKLVLRIKDNQCMDCVDSILQRLQNLESLLDPNKIIIISSYKNTAEIRKLLKFRNVPYKIYNSPVDIFQKTIENMTDPFLFLIDSSLLVRSLFFVRVSDGRTTDLYLKSTAKSLKKEYNMKYPITMEKTSSMAFVKTLYDLGNVKKGSKALVIAEFKNNSSKPLIITSITTACACTVASYPRSPISPNHSSTISINYDTKRVGSFDQTVYVFSNAIQSPIAVRIKGAIESNGGGKTE